MKRFAIALAVAVTALAVIVPTASAGTWLSVGAGKRAIKQNVSWTQVGTQFRSKIDTCWKPRGDRVRCFFQTSEYMGYDWLSCWGVAVATERFGWIDVQLRQEGDWVGDWTNNCYSTPGRDHFI